MVCRPTLAAWLKITTAAHWSLHIKSKTMFKEKLRGQSKMHIILINNHTATVSQLKALKFSVWCVWIAASDLACREASKDEGNIYCISRCLCRLGTLFHFNELLFKAGWRDRLCSFTYLLFCVLWHYKIKFIGKIQQ